MRTSQQGKAALIFDEGVKLEWYLDSTKTPTIGVGFTWASSAFREWWASNKPGTLFQKGAVMSRAQCMDALGYILQKEYEPAVDKFLGGQNVPQHVYDALVNMTFNCGPVCLTWKWAQTVKQGNYAVAATLLRNTAITSKGVRLQGLINRRARLAGMLSGGKYYGDGSEQAFPVTVAANDGTLKIGDSGEAVRVLQETLAAAGYAPGKVDGVFGHGTNAAVLQLQRDAGITADGKVGPKTRSALADAVAAHAKASFAAVAIPATPERSPAAGIVAILINLVIKLLGGRK